LNENLVELAEEGGFTREQIIRLAKNSFLATWAPEEDKERYLAMVEAYAA
jgi:adenosine deaminase